MKHFSRALLLSLRYKWSILGAISCSMMVAILWGASITTILPVLETVLNGKNATDWVDAKIEHVNKASADYQHEIDELLTEKMDAVGVDAVIIGKRIDARRKDVKASQQKAARYASFRPFVQTYTPQTPFGTLVASMIFLMAATALKGVFLVLSSVLVARIAHRTVMDMRRIYYRKALELDQIRIDRLGTTNMMTQLSHNMLMVGGGLIMFYGKTIREPLKMITCLAIAAWISWPLLLISLFVVPFGALAIQRVARSMKRSTEREMHGMSDVFETLIETFSAIKTVRIFNKERAERRRFKENAAMMYRMAVRIRFYDSLLRPITEFLGIVAIAVSVIAGAYLVLNKADSLLGLPIGGPLEATELILFYAMLAGASDPARKVSEILNMLVRGGTACENLFKTYEVEARVAAPINPTPLPLHSKEIKFQNVLFAYVPKQPVVKRLSLTIPYRQTLAIVGENGCGKSTLVNLLARFYDPHNGRIFIDGVDIREVSPKKLRRQIAWVTQDSTLFQGTVRENIAYGKQNPTEEEIQHAANLARIDTFIRDLPKGIDSHVGEGGSLLSAGQRQRVMLARAILADPRIFILDEATSQLDGHTEQLVHTSLQSFINSRTTIIITHRFSSIKLCERVVVMHQGSIVSDSTPDEAVATSEEFQFLFAKSA